MTLVIALLTFFPLVTISFAHLLWSLGTTWPLSNEQILAQTVVGRPGITRMPNRVASFIVAVLVFLAAIVAVGLGDPVDGGMARTGIGIFLIVVFALRGIAAYTPFWRRRFPTEPFASYDRKLYAPVCFWIAAGLLVMVVMRF